MERCSLLKVKEEPVVVGFGERARQWMEFDPTFNYAEAQKANYVKIWIAKEQG